MLVDEVHFHKGGPVTEKYAIISNDAKYRYALWRTWDDQKPKVLFICLNPSTADAFQDDRTVRRCVDFAHRWGFGGIAIGNLFAYRATRPQELIGLKDAVGKDNDLWLTKLRDDCSEWIAAWGADSVVNKREATVVSMFSSLKCLGVTRLGHPRHPLYISKQQALESFILKNER